MNTIMLKVDQLTKEFPGKKAVDSVSFEVARNSIHGFLGPNGAGKSTTMKMLVGLLMPTSGEFQIESSGKVGYLPESLPLYQNLTVKDYLSFVLNIYGEKSSKKERTILYESSLLKCGLRHVENKLIANLSKGYKQRVAIAGAIIFNPELVILDEPLVGLDPNAIIEIRKLIKEMSQDHTIIFSSHQLGEVERVCSDVTIINEGRILLSGKLQDVKDEVMGISRFIVTAKDLNIEQRLKESYELTSFESLDESTLRFDIKTREDIREELLAKLFSWDIGLAEFRQDDIDLEEIFKMVTHG